MARRAKSYNDLSRQFRRLYEAMPFTRGGTNPKRARVTTAFQNAMRQRGIAPGHALTGKGDVKKYIGGAVAG